MDRGAFTGTDPQYVLAISYPVETVYHDLGGNGLFEPTAKVSTFEEQIEYICLQQLEKQFWAARSADFLRSSTRPVADTDH